jgi:MFS family permease
MLLNHFAPNVGWRLAFLLGPVLALVVIIVGRLLPESPRWPMTHDRTGEAEKQMAKIEAAARKSGQLIDAEQRRRHKIAIGLTGEPVPVGSRSGAMTHRNDQRPAAAHACASPVNCR